MNDRKTDQRNSFQRDRDRVLYSSAFRRLAGVTQVVHTAEGHLFHTRLTHTLKVAQVGRRLAEYLVATTPETDIEAAGGIDPDVVETACLCHDIGHPPFGHIAEEELDSCLLDKGVKGGFEGNAQSFRIVTRVAIRNLEHEGLNLTRASLNALLKYPWPRSADGHQSRKWGFYESEREEFDFARGLETRGDQRRSAEAELMDWADDVTYSVHDVDDFYRTGFLPLGQLLAGGSERRRFLKWAQHKDLVKVETGDDWPNAFFDSLSELVSEELHVPFRGTPGQRAELNYLAALLIRRYLGIDASEPAIAVTPTANQRISTNATLQREVGLLKALMQFYVFDHPALVGQQHGHRRVVAELFGILFDACEPDASHERVLPPRVLRSLHEINEKHSSRSAKGRQQRARLVADVISSLTEQQALSLHGRLTGAQPGSVVDWITR